MKTIDKIIKEYFPDHNGSPEIVYEGQNNELYQIGDMIIRIPKNDFNKGKMEKEIELLNILKDKVNLQIPAPIHFEKGDYAFSSYKKIKGQALLKEVFQEIEDQKIIAKQLADFLKTLHTTDTDNLSLVSYDILHAWQDMYKRFKEKLYIHMKEDAKKHMDQVFEGIFELLSAENFEVTLVHGDFGPSNILYDQDKQEVSGIIDFSECAVSDPAYDVSSLIGLFGYGEDFLDLMKVHYPEIEDYKNRAMLYRETFALQEALYGVEHDDKGAFERGIENYLK